MRLLGPISILVLVLGGCGEEEPPRRPESVRTGATNRPERLRGRALIEAMFDAFEKREEIVQGRKVDGFQLVRSLLRHPGIDKEERSVKREDMKLIERLPGLLISRYRAPAQFDMNDRYRMSIQLLSGLVHEQRHIRTMTIDTLRGVYGQREAVYDPDAPREVLLQQLEVWTRFVRAQNAPPKTDPK